MERPKSFVAEPAAAKPAVTTLRRLLKSIEVEELRRAGFHRSKHPRRDCHRNRQAVPGQATLFWLVGHALGSHNLRWQYSTSARYRVSDQREECPLGRPGRPEASQHQAS